MIHILEVSPKHSVTEVMKLTRRYAMTGGVEIALPRECSVEELADLANMWIPEFSNMPGMPHEKRTSNAYRILELVKESPAVSSEIKASIETLLS
jgi:hypothetical protein